MDNAIKKRIKDPTFHLFKLSYLFRKPALVWRTALKLAKSLLLKKDELRAIDFAIDYRCNFNCEHCFAEPFKKADKKPLTLEEMQDFITSSVDKGIIHVSFQGGEVFCYPHLDELINACKPYKTYVSLTSNGFLVTKEKALRLKSLGLDEIRISLDSMDPSEHNRFRGNPQAFQKAMAAIEAVLSAGLNLQINITVSHANIRSQGVQDLFNYCVDNRISLGILQAIPAGKWRNNKEIILTDEDMAYLTDLNKKHPFIKRDIDYMFFSKGCPAVRRVVYITAFGDVLPCPFTHVSIGNIRDMALDVIRDRAMKLKYYATPSEKCWLIQNKEFYEDYVVPTFDAEALPLDGEKHFYKKG